MGLLISKKVKSQQQTKIVKKYMTVKHEELNNILINKSTGAKSYFCGINYFGFGATVIRRYRSRLHFITPDKFWI